MRPEREMVAWLGKGFLISSAFTVTGLAFGYLITLTCTGQERCGLYFLAGGMGGHVLSLFAASILGARESRRAGDRRVFRGTAGFVGAMLFYVFIIAISLALVD